MAKKIGILAIHGDVAEHAAILRKLKLDSVEVRTKKDFKNLDGLILPGGESTTISKLAERFGLIAEIKKFAKSRKPILGTCAGLILLAKIGLLDAKVERNAYGRQLDSFEADLKIPIISKGPISVAFIRAPKILSTGKVVEVLAKFEKVPVLIRQKNILAASFHPEILGTTSIHKFIFLNAK
ncbi:MAG: pyridoxal 5'-phosphate synthase glutaminase subunit PdxT [Candidatus Peribacteraceae bacterium]|nr:pyridoxal 5'-phosphate synthase glutaminase subunit PdxT [Candidatus Peribacteraceae bacterium]